MTLAVFWQQYPVSQNTSTEALVPPTSAAIFSPGTSTAASVYTDATASATVTNNPLPTGVTPTTPTSGIDTNGNVGAWLLPGPYDLVVNGLTSTPYRIYVFTDPSDLAVGAQFGTDDPQALGDVPTSGDPSAGVASNAHIHPRVVPDGVLAAIAGSGTTIQHFGTPPSAGPGDGDIFIYDGS